MSKFGVECEIGNKVFICMHKKISDRLKIIFLIIISGIINEKFTKLIDRMDK